MVNVVFSRQDAYTHLEMLADLGQIHLVAITPDGPITGRDFGTDSATALAWAETENAKGRNLHWTVNRVRAGVHDKPSKADVVEPRFLHVDSDPPKDGSPWDKSAIIAALLCDPISPSLIIDSGNGIQAFYPLSELIIDHALVERANRALAAKYSGDKCHSIDHLMRLPGSINWPNKKKQELGRIPALASTIIRETGRYLDTQTVASLAASYVPPAESERPEIDIGDCLPQTVHSLGINPYSPLARAINRPAGADRSADVYHCAMAAFERGYTASEIAGLLLNADNPISAHCLAQTSRTPQNAAARVIAKAMADTPPDILERAALFRADCDGANSLWDKIFPPGAIMPPVSATSVRAATIGAGGIAKVNACVTMLEMLGVSARFDKRHNTFEICVPDGLNWPDRPAGCLPLSDATIRQLCLEVGRRMKVSADVMDAALRTIGDRSPFDPVVDYLEALPAWDNQPRLGRLLADYCRADDTPLNAGFGRHFMLGAIARACWPGCSHDEVLALTGLQGSGKSSFAKILGGDWYSDAPILGLETQKIMERLAGAWIHEIAEVKLTGKDGNAVKAFFTTTHHKARLAYGRVVDTLPAQWVHVSTGNNDAFLTDTTGNRRWHVVPVGDINLAALKRDRDQLWAEALQAFKTMFPEWQAMPRNDRRIPFPETLWEAAAIAADGARLKDPWEEGLEAMIADGRITSIPTAGWADYPVGGFVSNGDLLKALQTAGLAQGSDRRNEMRLSAVCISLGWKAHRQRNAGNPRRGYLIPEISSKENGLIIATIVAN